MGFVVEWNRVWGWIRADITYDIPEARRHGGKLYVHIKDSAKSLPPSLA